MIGERGVQIGRDAQGNVIITGDHNQVYVFLGVAELPAELLHRLREGEVRPADLPEAVPLPTLTLRIRPAGDAPAAEGSPDHRNGAWTIVSSLGGERTVEAPWQAERGFAAALDGFWKLTQDALETEDRRRTLHAHGTLLGTALAAMLDEDERALLERASRADGPPPLLVVESDDDLTLALPWELLLVDGRFPVRDGRLDVARCVPADGAPPLALPADCLRLVVNVSAPSDSRLDYEAESYRITRALHDYAGVYVAEMGEAADLIAGVTRDPPPLGVHFSGHGGPGTLVFEDAYGESESVAVSRLLDEMRRAAPARFPRFFYLASCHGNTPPALSFEVGGKAHGGASASASQLHREGVAQVVGYFGPVFDVLSTRAEEAFYRALAQGRRTRDGVRAARAALARPLDFDADRAHREAAAATAREGVAPYAWAQLVLYHRGPDYPLSRPIPERYPEELEARLTRHEERAGGKRVILRTGFVGRRRDLHALRRRIREGRHVHVVQGLGGMGKSTLCFEALKLYGRRHQIALWCAEVQSDPRPADALARQLSDTLAGQFGEGWNALAAQVDRRGDLSPAQRVAAYLSALPNAEGLGGLVLYLDDLNSLLSGPGGEDPSAMGEWRDAECRELWAALLAVQSQSRGRLAIVASCRYRNADFARHLVPLGPLSDDALFRLMGWFDGLRRLAAANRAALVRRLSGHPRGVEWLDKLVAASLLEWERRHGDRPAATSPDAVTREWDEIVAPALPGLERQLTQDLLLGAIWDRILDPPSRRMLVRLTILRRPWDWRLMRALADPASTDAEAESAIDTLRDRAALLTEVRERRSDGGEAAVFELHPSIARFALERADDAEDLRREAFRAAGDCMESRARGSPDLRDDLDAGHYLLEAGEGDRAFDLLGNAAALLQGWGRYRDSLAVLAPFVASAPDAPDLHARRRGSLHVLLADAHVGSGNLGTALAAMRVALDAFGRLVEADPSNAQWQRDLSVSHERLGDILAAQGQLADALAAFRAALAIAERLARQDPTNAGWQRDLSVSHIKVGDILAAQGQLADALAAFRAGLAIAERLARQDPTNAEWQRDLSVSHERLGDILAERLARQDPTNAQWQRDLSVSHIKVGDILAAQGQLADALAAFRAALAIAERLARQDPTNAQWQRDLAISCQRMGEVLEALGDGEQARDFRERAEAILRRLGRDA